MFVWRPFIIWDKIFLNGTIFLYQAQTKHIVLNDTVLFLYPAQICEKNM